MGEDEVMARVRASVQEIYDLGRELGGGGMSRVFRATERASGRQVVLKVLPPDLAADISLARFKREIDVAARMRHVNIVPMLGSGEADGLPWFAMPFVDGETLRERIGSRTRLPVTEAMRILRDMASALAYAHRKGIVHRDIKPENVLLSSEGAVITDFGVAKALMNAEGVATDSSAPRLTTRRIALGTPTYMSPEQASGDPRVGTRADIYAWGIVAYELLAGCTPFDGRSLHGQLRAHVNEVPVSLAVHRPTTPAELVELVQRCLQKSPADRPQLADQLVEALDSISLASSTSTLPAGMPAVDATGARLQLHSNAASGSLPVAISTAPDTPASTRVSTLPDASSVSSRERSLAAPTVERAAPPIVPASVAPLHTVAPTGAPPAAPRVNSARSANTMITILIGVVIVGVLGVLLLRAR
jgi:serine/threonine-protein kinase